MVALHVNVAIRNNNYQNMMVITWAKQVHWSWLHVSVALGNDNYQNHDGNHAYAGTVHLLYMSEIMIHGKIYSIRYDMCLLYIWYDMYLLYWYIYFKNNRI